MQLSLFGGGVAAVAGFQRLRRSALDAGSWLDYAPEFVRGHEALFARLATMAGVTDEFPVAPRSTSALKKESA